MIPIVTPEEMRAIDADAPEPLEVLIARAGAAVARTAVAMLGGTYGRRVVVVAGKGNNGADGREAARRLRAVGVRVTVVEATASSEALPACDLVVDAAYGTGFRGSWGPPDPGGVAVLAVDIPSGVDGMTGASDGDVLRAERTITFAALKPGLLLAGPALSGEVEVADIGLDVSRARAHLVQDADAAAALPERPRDSHKWRAAVWVIAGSPGMTGAAALCARGAQRAGAGYVRLSTPGATVGEGEGTPVEAVGVSLPAARSGAGGWADAVLADVERFAAVVVGPGLGRDEATAAEVRRLVQRCPVPLVVDGDGLTALGVDVARLATATTVLTPHDGEYERLTGVLPAADRFGAVRSVADDAGCTVLLKGPTTLVAGPDGVVRATTTGDVRLASAGTGDVLSGVIGALLASGLDPATAASTGAFLHGRAATLGHRRGLVAGDLPDLVPRAIESLQES